MGPRLERPKAFGLNMDKEMVEIKIVLQGGPTDSWADFICVEVPRYTDLKKMYGAGSCNELRMVYLMNQQNWEIFSAHGDETPEEEKQKRRSKD